MPVRTQAYGKRNLLLLKTLNPVDGNKLTVGHQRLDRRSVDDGQKPFENLDLIAGSGASSLRQHRPSDRKGDPSMSNADHQNVNRGLSEMPLCAIHHGHVGRSLREKLHEKRAQSRKIEVVIRQETLDSSVVRLVLDPGFQRNGNFPEVRRLQLKQPGGKTGHKLQSGAVPSKMVGENASDRSYVLHRERG